MWYDITKTVVFVKGVKGRSEMKENDQRGGSFNIPPTDSGLSDSDFSEAIHCVVFLASVISCGVFRSLNRMMKSHPRNRDIYHS